MSCPVRPGVDAGQCGRLSDMSGLSGQVTGSDPYSGSGARKLLVGRSCASRMKRPTPSSRRYAIASRPKLKLEKTCVARVRA